MKSVENSIIPATQLLVVIFLTFCMISSAYSLTIIVTADNSNY